ncbi:MAG: hypothetical protein AB1394_13755 [Bacteroidota bacterium]
MVLPTSVIQKIIDTVEAAVETNPILVKPLEGSEDTSRQPKQNIVVYADFDENATLDSKKNFPTRLPCSVYVASTSAAFQTAAESFNQAFLMSVSILKIISLSNYFMINNTDNVPERVNIKLQDMPIVIVRKSANASTVTLQLTYDISI